MQININVANKIATPENAPVIICGNSDYEAVFAFDSEWDDYKIKTARFTYVKDHKNLYTDVVFGGETCKMPVLSDITEVKIGVYAGDLCTTTPARVECKKSILCGDPVHIEPPEDIYNQMSDKLNKALQYSSQAVSAAQAAEAECEELHEQTNVLFTNFDAAVKDAEKLQALTTIIEKNKSHFLSFWYGTKEEYNAITEKAEDCFYIITDDTRLDDMEGQIYRNERNISLLQQGCDHIMQEAVPALQQNITGLTEKTQAAPTMYKVLKEGSVSGVVRYSDNTRFDFPCPGAENYSILKINGQIYTKKDCSNDTLIANGFTHCFERVASDNYSWIFSQDETMYASIISETYYLGKDENGSTILSYFNGFPFGDDYKFYSYAIWKFATANGFDEAGDATFESTFNIVNFIPKTDRWWDEIIGVI